MDANNVTLVKLFQGDRQFRIPLYQRSYVWDLDLQWEPLWEDVTRVAEAVLAGKESITPHFLGAVVVSQSPQPTGDLEIRDVIDGQQRLTTLQLLMDAVEEVLRESNHSTESRRLRSLLLNDDGLFFDDDQFKVRPTSADQVAFRNAMDDHRVVSPETAETNIVRAHEYFKASARKWVSNFSSNDTKNRFSALVTAIRNHLCVVVIDLTVRDNHHAIFETLNARGTPLLASDLVKNHLLHEAERQDLDVERIYRENWKHFEDPWWHGEITLGRLRWPRLDAFLYYWLGMHLAQDVNTQQLFGVYREFVAEANFSPQSVASDFASLSRTFRSIEDGEFLCEETEFFERRNVLNLRVLTPLLLWLFGAKSAPSQQTRKACLRLLESWFMRRMICGHSAQGYQDYLSAILRDVKEQPVDHASTVVADALSIAVASGTKWPTDEEILSAVLHRPMFSYSSKPRLRLILEALEDQKRYDSHGKTEDARCPKGLTLEHIMPQTWSPEDWPLPDSRDHNTNPEDEREALVHTLGNLTLVTNKLNPALSNLPWGKKRHELRKHSVLLLNRELVELEAWDDDTIRQRGRSLAHQICRIWPRAEVGLDDVEACLADALVSARTKDS